MDTERLNFEVQHSKSPNRTNLRRVLLFVQAPARDVELVRALVACREGGGWPWTENGRYANRETALMFPIVSPAAHLPHPLGYDLVPALQKCARDPAG